MFPNNMSSYGFKGLITIEETNTSTPPLPPNKNQFEHKSTSLVIILNTFSTQMSHPSSLVESLLISKNWFSYVYLFP